MISENQIILIVVLTAIVIAIASFYKYYLRKRLK